MNRRLVWLGSVVGLIALIGHGIFWYSPRIRSSEPREGRLLDLLENQSFAYSLWVPYPHQNIGAVQRAGRVDRRIFEALARLAGFSVSPGRKVTVPPSSAICFAADETGERFAILADVYPAFALFVRWAGRLAGNSWLEGGVIESSEGEIEVSWEGNIWSASRGEVPESSPPVALVAEQPTLGLGRLHREIWGVPAIDFSITSSARRVEIRSDGEIPRALRVVRRGFERFGVYLLVVEGGRVPFQALAHFSQQDLDPSEQPRIAAVFEPGAERPSFPGESLLELSGRKARMASFGELQVTALDSESVERGRRIAPLLLPLRRPSGPTRLTRAVWFDFSLGHQEVEKIADRLASVPVVPSARRQYWNDLEFVLGLLDHHFDRMTLEVTDDPPALRLLLHRSMTLTDP